MGRFALLALAIAGFSLSTAPIVADECTRVEVMRPDGRPPIEVEICPIDPPAEQQYPVVAR